MFENIYLIRNVHSSMVSESMWKYQASFKQCLNPLTLRVSLENIVCYFRTFVNNSGIKQKLSKYLKESCHLTSG